MPIPRLQAIALAALVALAAGRPAHAADEPAAAKSAETGEQGDSGPFDAKKVKHIKGLATTGYIFALAGAGAMISSWITYMPHVGEKADSLPPAWFVLISTWGASAAIAVPLLQATSFKARKLLGLPPADGFFIASWIFFGLTFAAIAFVDANPVYSMLYATIGYTSAMLWSWWGTGRSLRRLRRAIKASQETQACIAPWVTAMPGGAMAGVAGTF